MKKKVSLLVVLLFVINVYAIDGEALLNRVFNPYTQPGIKKIVHSLSISSSNPQFEMMKQMMPKIIVNFTAPDKYQMSYKFSDSVPVQMRKMILPIMKQMTSKMGIGNEKEQLLKFKKEYSIKKVLKNNDTYVIEMVKKNDSSKSVKLYISSDYLLKKVETIVNGKKMVIDITYKKVGKFTVFDKYIMGGTNSITLIYDDYKIN